MISRTESAISELMSPAELVKMNYRTAAVFRRYGIEFCCGARFPLQLICKMKDLDLEVLQQELREAIRPREIPGRLAVENWSIDFLIDYILNIHHQYLHDSIEALGNELDHFVLEHEKKYPQYLELKTLFQSVTRHLSLQLNQEASIIFPYIRQISHAWRDGTSYARLFVRTLRKPIETQLQREHQLISHAMEEIRNISNQYQPPANACTSHALTFALLREFDDNLVQHFFLENNFLFPRAIAMEKEMLDLLPE